MLAIWSLWSREVIRFFRQRSRIVGALGTPLVFWILIGSGFGERYQLYLFPGSLTMILLFAAIFSTISIIEDRREGFLQGVLVAPVPRAAIVTGKVLGGTTVAMLQALAFLALAPLAGIGLSAASAALTAGVMVIVATGLTALGTAIAWRLDSTQGFHAVMNLFLMPMWLLSGALFPAEGAATWLRGVMRVDPLTYGLAAIRAALDGRVDGVAILVSAGFSLLMIAVATGVASSRGRGGA